MDEPLFEAKIERDYKEFRKYCFYMLKQKEGIGPFKNIRTFIVFMVFWETLSILLSVGLIILDFMVPLAVGVLIFMLAMALIVCFLPICAIKKNYASQGDLDTITSIYFYEDAYVGLSGEKIPYEKLHKIYESKTNFYLMKDANIAMNIVKAHCDDELIEFLSALKIKINGAER